jgi:hypothetical protein
MPPRREPVHPNPGSAQARELGCRCPVTSNFHGEKQPFDDGWVTTGDCPLHWDWP